MSPKQPKQPKKPKAPAATEEGLGAVAAAKRKAKGPPGREADRTTLNIHDPLAEASASPDAIGEQLVNKGLISRHQLFNALNESYRTGSSLRDALVSLGYITAEALDAEGL